jgi:molybdenum cofactor guanylyltransferase
MKLYGYVQAGGGSTRFGQDKALAKLDGKTLLRRTSEVVAAVSYSVKVVGAADRYPESTVPVIEDGWPGEGPLGGIITALLETRRTSSEAVWSLIVSCDMPFLTTDWLQAMRERALGSSAQVIVPRSKNGLEPLCACWRSDSVTKLQGAFESGVRKVTEAMRHLSMEVLDETVWKRFDNGNRLFWNMNTREEYEEAQRIIAKQSL